MLTIYGSSTCAACKTLLSMAKAQGIEATYRLIDQDDDARKEYDARGLESRVLPLTVLIRHGVRLESAGLQAGLTLLKVSKENPHD